LSTINSRLFDAIETPMKKQTKELTCKKTHLALSLDSAVVFIIPSWSNHEIRAVFLYWRFDNVNGK
jgi:hypothetical protein